MNRLVVSRHRRGGGGGLAVYYRDVSAGKILIAVGIVIVGIGVLVQVGLPLGRLPGDIKLGGGNFTVYAPLATGLLISIVLTVVINLLIRR